MIVSESFLDTNLAEKRSPYQRQAKLNPFFFFISSLILWVISSLSLTLSSSLWCSPRLHLTEERLFLSCSSVLFNCHPENIFYTTQWEKKEYSRLNASKTLSTVSVYTTCSLDFYCKCVTVHIFLFGLVFYKIKNKMSKLFSKIIPQR